MIFRSRGGANLDRDLLLYGTMKSSTVDPSSGLFRIQNITNQHIAN
jgi:hypothetical protein